MTIALCASDKQVGGGSTFCFQKEEAADFDDTSAQKDVGEQEGVNCSQGGTNVKHM